MPPKTFPPYQRYNSTDQYDDVSLSTLGAGEDLVANRLLVEQRNSYNVITTNATTVVKTGTGFLHTITIDNPALITVANLTLSIFDNTAASGTSLGVFTVPFGLVGAVPFTIELDVAFTTGLTILTAGPTVPAILTVSYR